MVSRYVHNSIIDRPTCTIIYLASHSPSCRIFAFSCYEKRFFLRLKTININASVISEIIYKRKTVHKFYQSHYIKVAQGSSSFSVLFLYDLIKYFFVLPFVFYLTENEVLVGWQYPPHLSKKNL